jgi:hypothetical protein
MGAASRDYVGKGCGLDLLVDAIKEHFQVQGYQTQSSKRPDGSIVQARKGGVLRDLRVEAGGAESTSGEEGNQ